MTRTPYVYEYDLGCSAEAAFAAYVDLAAWWPPEYTANAATLVAVTIEPRLNGRVYEAHRGGEEHTWGEVTIWEPGRRLVHTFTLAHPPRLASEIAVHFTPRTSGCRMRFEHGGWTDENAGVRAKFSEWPILLARFVARTEPAVTPPGGDRS